MRAAPDIDNAPTPHEAMRDEQLMLAYAGGDTAAFDTLYGRHEGALYRFVQRLMGARSGGEIDEVFQESWSRIVSARESFSLQGVAWRTWAFTIAHSLAADRLASSRRTAPPPAPGGNAPHASAALLPGRPAIADAADSAGEDVAAPPSAEDAAFWRAAGTRMLACLDELPLAQRSAFLLHQEDGFTVETMAAALDVNSDAVRRRLREALATLRGGMATHLAVMQARQ